VPFALAGFLVAAIRLLIVARRTPGSQHAFVTS